MSVTRNYFNSDRRRDRPGFNYRRNERSLGGNIPTSRHSIFIRGLPASVNPKAVKSFFMDESRSNVLIDFVSYTDDHKKLCIAIRFESHQIAKEIYNKFNNREVLGHIVEFSWFKDMKAVKDNERRFRDKNYLGRKPRRFNDRSIRSGSRNYRSRSKQRFRDSFDKKKDYKSRSQSRDSATSSSFSKSRSVSESLSARSSASPTRLIRNINKHKYKKRNNSDSYVSRGGDGHSRDRTGSKSDLESDHPKKSSRIELEQMTKDQNEFTQKTEPMPLTAIESCGVVDEVAKSVDSSIPSARVTELDDCTKIKTKSTELLDSYGKDIENYLTVINGLISTNPSLEAPIVESLKHVLNEIGENYVCQFLKYIETISPPAVSPKC